MFLIPDKHNFHERNVSALLNALRESNADIHFDEYRDDIKKAQEEYAGFRSEFYSGAKYFSGKAPEELATLEYKGVKLFETVKYELFAQIYQQDYLFENAINCNEESYWQLIFPRSKNLLCTLYAVAQFWIKHWDKLLKRETSIHACFVFSNVLIYTRTLSSLLSQISKPCYIIEHFFTGNDFYLEQRYSALPNDSQLQSGAYREKYLNNDADPTDVGKKLASAKNKNVTQPPPTKASHFSEKENICLLLCQVSNDAAIFSPNNKFRNTIAFYCQFIDGLLSATSHCILVKTHPYEPKKNKKRRKITYDFLSSKYAGNERVKVVDSVNLNTLIDSSSYVATLNSQSGIEAALRRKSVLTFGGAFYAHAGFTQDYEDIDLALKQISACGIPQYSEKNAQNLQLFLSAAFAALISNHFDEKKKTRLAASF